MRNTIIAVVAAASILFAAPSQAAGKASRQENARQLLSPAE